MNDILDRLFSMRDEAYRGFNAKLIPTVPPEKIIGVRTPELRKYAKELVKSHESETFIACLPHEYHEENALHAFILEEIKDFDSALRETERFLPYIDNWAVCDTFAPKAFKKNTEALLPKIKEWLGSPHTYTVRYAVGLLMSLYLDGNFKAEYLALAASVKSEEYYVNMMIAWYFATALAKRYDEAVVYIEQRRLSPWVHNKTIQKAAESLRVPAEKKEYLRTLKIKAER